MEGNTIDGDASGSGEGVATISGQGTVQGAITDAVITHDEVPEATRVPLSLPSTYRIGKHNPPPLISLDEVKAHLKLLGAFDLLRTQVQSQLGVAQTNPEGAWALFLTRAVYRFDEWAAGFKYGEEEFHAEICPPLDVLMVWHTYCLNPRTYYEDYTRKSLSELKILRSFPLILVSSLISDTFYPMDPTPKRAREFEERAGEPYHPPLLTLKGETASIMCPLCPEMELLTVPWSSPDNKLEGYGQRNFVGTCPKMGQFNAEAIGVRKFCQDVFARVADPETFYLPGTLLDPKRGTPDTARAKSFNDALIKVFTDKVVAGSEYSEAHSTPDTLAKDLDWKMSKVAEFCQEGIWTKVDTNRDLPRRVSRVLNAYRHTGAASIDLRSAVLRQGAFIRKMVQLGWTAPGRFENEQEVVLVRAITRYHAFLDLMSSGPAFSVPTLDIDLAWHTHQLKAVNYREETLEILGRLPDHDDTVEESSLSKFYDKTAKAWKERFGVPYSLCGCAPNPPPGTISRLASKIFKSELPGGPVANNKRPDLLSTEPEDADATHPSEHNSTFISGDKKSQQRRGRREDRVLQSVEEIKTARVRHEEKGKGETWSELQVRNRENERENHREAYSSAYTWPDLYPYGSWGTSGACAAYDGGLAIPDHIGSCATGSKHSQGSCAVGGGAACSFGLHPGSFCGGDGGGGCGGCRGDGGCGGGGD